MRSTDSVKIRSQRATPHATASTITAREPMARLALAGMLSANWRLAILIASKASITPTGAASTTIDSRTMPSPFRAAMCALWCINLEAPQPTAITIAATSSSATHCQSSISNTVVFTRNSGRNVIHQTPIARAIGGMPFTVSTETTQSSASSRINCTSSSSLPSTSVPNDTGSGVALASSPGMDLKSSHRLSSSINLSARAT